MGCGFLSTLRSPVSIWRGCIGLQSWGLVFLASAVLMSCSVLNLYIGVPGITYVTSVGHPPADTLLWSPADPKQMLVNAKGIGPGHAQIYVLDMVTKRKTLLAETEAGVIGASSWSPDGSRFLFGVAWATKEYPQAGLWIFNVSDRSMNLVSTKGGGLWLPDGTHLAILDRMLEAYPGGLVISLLDMSAGTRTTVYSNWETAYLVGASASPDGRYLVLSLGSGNLADLFVLDLTTGAAARITDHGDNTFPQWSPKANVIVYDNFRVDAGKSIWSIHLINSDGTCDTEIPRLRHTMSPTWSPDGRMLAFIGLDGIYTVDLAKLLGRDITEGLCPSD